jgi:hypothetical protein
MCRCISKPCLGARAWRSPRCSARPRLGHRTRPQSRRSDRHLREQPPGRARRSRRRRRTPRRDHDGNHQGRRRSLRKLREENEMRLLIVGPSEDKSPPPRRSPWITARKSRTWTRSNKRPPRCALRGADLLMVDARSISRRSSRQTKRAHRVPIVAAGVGVDPMIAAKSIRRRARIHLAAAGCGADRCRARGGVR